MRCPLLWLFHFVDGSFALPAFGRLLFRVPPNNHFFSFHFISFHFEPSLTLKLSSAHAPRENVKSVFRFSGSVSSFVFFSVFGNKFNDFLKPKIFVLCRFGFCFERARFSFLLVLLRRFGSCCCFRFFYTFVFIARVHCPAQATLQ